MVSGVGRRVSLTGARLRVLVRYEPETGEFYLRERLNYRGEPLPSRRIGHGSGNGYRYVSIEGRRYGAHRLAWLYMTGRWPEHQIDHRDGNRANNAFGNLREATMLANSGNRGPNKNNRSGYKGVFAHGSRWAAQISINGRHTHLGIFDDPAAAGAAYERAAREHFGDFART